jgi:hypothetical protein
VSKVTLDEETIDGAVRGIESGRRVGWAKAFEALRRADSAERDVNVLRSDNRILASFAARCYGALEVTADKRVTELFRGDNHELASYLPQGPLDQGRDAMRALLGKRRDELNTLRRRIGTLRGVLPELQAESDRRWVAAKRKVRSELMEQFGIPDDDEFFGWLAQYREQL